MKKWLRPSILVGLGLLIGVLAAVQWWLRTPAPLRPVALPVEEGDMEVAWLNSATSAAAWERFVTAASQATGVTPGPEAFPVEATATPQLFIPLPGRKGRLVVRWYKLTGVWKSRDWLEVLLARNPPPLAVMGGSNSDAASNQARNLAELTKSLPEQNRPLLLLTAATADAVVSRDKAEPRPIPGEHGWSPDQPDVPLIGLYPGRTFRFCFTNRQMGEAVMSFVWSQPELRPDTDPVYLVTWEDDSYSRDLIGGFWQALSPHMQRTAALTVATEWAQMGGLAATGGLPVQGLVTPSTQFRFCMPPQVYRISWSVGAYDQPNRLEGDASQYLLDDLERQPAQRRPLLVLGGQTQPSRRFLRSLCRSAPIRARDFVVAAGDAIAFNTVYRDRNVAWPIQDMPCSLVFFCHHNPIDRGAGFGVADPGGEDFRAADTGTEELLLYKDIINALRLAATAPEPATNANVLRERLRELHWAGGKPTLAGGGEPLFEDDGDRRPGSGEHVVWLRPVFRAGGVRPEAVITVYAWEPEKQAWTLVDRPLHFQYNQPPPERP